MKDFRKFKKLEQSEVQGCADPFNASKQAGGVTLVTEGLNSCPVDKDKKLIEQREIAFTLAEVLITLGIIGVVAAMTLPALVANYKDKELATRTRKAFSAINQAAQLAQAKYNTPGDNASLFDTAKSSDEVTQEFAKYFNGAKYCAPDTATNSQCKDLHYSIKYANRLESSYGTNAVGSMYTKNRIVLSDGTVIAIMQYDTPIRTNQGTSYNEDGSIKTDADGNPILHTYTDRFRALICFDVNGSKQPNQFGRDAFQLLVYDNQIIPGGSDRLYGVTSLKNILSGGNAVYTNYNRGEKFEW